MHVLPLSLGLDDADWSEVARLVAEMEKEGRDVLAKTIPAEAVTFRRLADMRYRKQGYEVRVAVPAGQVMAVPKGVDLVVFVVPARVVVRMIDGLVQASQSTERSRA